MWEDVQFMKLLTVQSLYEYIGILLGARPILNISRIKVNSEYHDEVFAAMTTCQHVLYELF
jgi:hypothetical protein